MVQGEDGNERLYFVVETKSGLFTDDLRAKEQAKLRKQKDRRRRRSAGDGGKKDAPGAPEK